MNTRLIPVMIALAILSSTLVTVAAASGFTHHKAFADPWHCGSQTMECCSVGEHWKMCVSLLRKIPPIYTYIRIHHHLLLRPIPETTVLWISTWLDRISHIGCMWHSIRLSYYHHPTVRVRMAGARPAAIRTYFSPWLSAHVCCCWLTNRRTAER